LSITPPDAARERRREAGSGEAGASATAARPGRVPAFVAGATAALAAADIAAASATASRRLTAAPGKVAPGGAWGPGAGAGGAGAGSRNRASRTARAGAGATASRAAGAPSKRRFMRFHRDAGRPHRSYFATPTATASPWLLSAGRVEPVQAIAPTAGSEKHQRGIERHRAETASAAAQRAVPAAVEATRATLSGGLASATDAHRHRLPGGQRPESRNDLAPGSKGARRKVAASTGAFDIELGLADARRRRPRRLRARVPVDERARAALHVGAHTAGTMVIADSDAALRFPAASSA
jgi:hypothetical protein